ncbi:MAG: hypothetical protein A3G87_01385 [Omnitrophica bacterium RIFCSPLOWO2_12_FULL_50_11]|nr:MAG: hypothetical protein A3G87_01385 [Omnitrophica bacterium RIFCSPLOWO2_12_FULL_50_11]
MILCFTSLLLLVTGCHNSLSQEEIVDAARAVAAKEGFDLHGKSVLYDRDNEEWKETQKILRQVGSSMGGQLSQLVDRDYQVVYFSPENIANTRGGGFWVFIDKKTGEVITFFGEE